MPRQIIDTESGRPAYVRRRITTYVAIAVVLAALAVAAWLYWSHLGAALPGNSAH